MISKWENPKERLLKFMDIAPKKKLEWLHKMHDFFCKALTKKQQYFYYRLRETR